MGNPKDLYGETPTQCNAYQLGLRVMASHLCSLACVRPSRGGGERPFLSLKTRQGDSILTEEWSIEITDAHTLL